MSTEVSSKGYSPMLNDLGDSLDRYLPDSSELGRTILESSAIVQVSYASLKNVPYALLSPGFGLVTVKHVYDQACDWDLRPIPGAIKLFFQTLLTPEALAARVTYVEAAAIGVVTVVHNLFFASLYTFLSIMTLGFSKNLNLRCRIHWSHFTYGVVASGISAVGMLSPECGVLFNLLHLKSLRDGFKRSYDSDLNFFERPFLLKFQQIVRKHRETIHFFYRVRAEDSLYVKSHRPSLLNIERRISVATRMDDLYEVAWDILKEWPNVGLKDPSKASESASIVETAAVTPSPIASPAAHDHYEKK